jgi:deoxyribodipyrimidine photo-lyase
MSEMDQVFYSCKLGSDYPFPIVDLDVSRKHASDVLHGIKKTILSKANGQLILSKHVSKTRSSSFIKKTKENKSLKT